MDPVFAFTARESDCDPAHCWQKLKWMLNFEVPVHSHVAQQNIGNFKTSCEPCASLESCPEKLTLPDFLGRGLSRNQDDVEAEVARARVEEALDAEGITLNPVIDDEEGLQVVMGSGQDDFIGVNQIMVDDNKNGNATVWVRAPSFSLSDENKSDIEASTNIQVVKDIRNHPLASAMVRVNSSNPSDVVTPDNSTLGSGASCDAVFPLPCKVQAGPDGDEWLETAQENCFGNELVIQIHPDYPESLIAIRIDSVDHVARYGRHTGKEYGFIDAPIHEVLDSDIGEDTWPFAPFLKIEQKAAGGIAAVVSLWHSKAAVKVTIIGKDGQSVKLAPLQELRLYFVTHKATSVSFGAVPAPTVIRTPPRAS